VHKIKNQFAIKKGREDRIFILDYTENQGKGESVRKGMLAAIELSDFSIIGYFDADLATPLSEIPMLTAVITNMVVFTFGSRIKRIGVCINRKTSRHILGRVFATIASNMLNMNVYDTQCGAKFFHRSVVKALFTEKFQTSWIFDVEVFFRIKAHFKGRDVNQYAVEIPLSKWNDVAGSKIKFRHFLKIPFELLKLRKYQ
jgi:glycosyltransferase involved in cell wall biosynthesis